MRYRIIYIENTAKKPSRGLVLNTIFFFYDSLERIKQGGRINTSREK